MMKALILASGIGKRLMPLTKETPKPLLKINEKETILSYELKLLKGVGIKEIIITTGPNEEKIKDYGKKNFSELKITYIHNPRYDSTNYIYSLWLTKNEIDDNVILIHGDLVFEKILLQKLLDDERENCVLVNKNRPLPKKDFKARIVGEKIKEIGVNVFGKEAFFCAPLYKLSKRDFRKWVGKIDEFIKKGKVNCYAEDAFNQISDDIFLYPVYYEKEFCMEIDNIEDLKIARVYFSSKGI
jgi:phosphoenolpyruvate phosphomutase